MNKIVELKKKGIFFEAKHEDAYILWYLMDYKVIDGRVGFPTSSLNKVINILERNHVFCKVILKEGNVIYHKGKNEYDIVLEKAKKKYSRNKKIEYLKEKLIQISDEKIEEIVDYLVGTL